jgi:hypothetical protein
MVLDAAHRQALMERHFEGDERLFEAFRAASAAQLERDGRNGDAAAMAGDATVLRRLGHDLKTVLQLLGDDSAAAQAEALEQAATHAPADAVALRAAWQPLRRALSASIG